LGKVVPYPTHRLILALKALGQLGPRQIAAYISYQLGLRSGYLRWATQAPPETTRTRTLELTLQPLIQLPDPHSLADLIGPQGKSDLLAEADEIAAGKARLFGAEPVDLQLAPAHPLAHWTAYELGRQPWGSQDVKLIWEPARFSWAFKLGYAYHLSKAEQYPRSFWVRFEEFLDKNPPDQGPNWISAQEVALRIVAFVFAAQVFAASSHSTPERMHRLAGAVARHASRIPCSLAYARAQNNNHLLSEALGLYTAGLTLPEHPQARAWREKGWQLFNRGLQAQIDPDGVYTQHSANYQRLMLQLALWAQALARGEGCELPALTRQRLASATRWLMALVDRNSGGAPNLGPNDSAYILPLTSSPISDYRPVLQAAGQAFLGKSPFLSGRWDEMALWFGPYGSKMKASSPASQARPMHPAVLYSPHHDSWAYLRIAHFRSRPGHADQLHFDLWWHGVNIALDPGTFRYSAPAPWENALTQTAVHNTMVIAGSEQMLSAGRFLYLDWAQAELIAHARAPDGAWERLIARHDGYRRLGWLHQRTVETDSQGWLVTDETFPVKEGQAPGINIACDLHWLLPDWSWEIAPGSEAEGASWLIHLSSPFGRLSLIVSCSQPNQPGEKPGSLSLAIDRAGERIFGVGRAAPYAGWTSPSYGDKIPALSLTASLNGLQPLWLTSRWIFP
jgi:hypothetical protein